jgi:hypothetical protein
MSLVVFPAQSVASISVPELTFMEGGLHGTPTEMYMFAYPCSLTLAFKKRMRLTS